MKRFGQNRKSRTSITMAFSAILLSVLFAGSAFLVLLFGARVYESIVEKSAESYTSRTLLTYITEKIRHFDSDGNVSVRQLDGISALALESAQADEKILTYIYEYEGSIRELTVADEAQWNPEDGDAIFQVSDFEAEEIQPGLLHFSCLDGKGNRSDSYVHVHADMAGGEEGA